MVVLAGLPVASYTSRAAERLRSQSSVASHLQVFIETNRFNIQQPQYQNGITLQLEQPSAYTPTMVAAAVTGLERIFKVGYRYKRAGVMLLGITHQDQIQQGLWGEAYSEHQRQAMAVMDEINARFGKGTIKLAAAGLKQSWQMRSDMRSPRYTTRWDEIATVKAIA